MLAVSDRLQRYLCADNNLAGCLDDSLDLPRSTYSIRVVGHGVLALTDRLLERGYERICRTTSTPASR